MHAANDEGRTDGHASAIGTVDATTAPGGRTATASDGDVHTRPATLATALVGTRVGDVVVTYHGLRAGLVEANPVADAVMGAVGVVPALVGWSALVLASIVGAAVVGDRALSRADTTRAHRRLARTVWLGAPALVWLGVCVYNLTLTVGAS